MFFSHVRGRPQSSWTGPLFSVYSCLLKNDYILTCNYISLIICQFFSSCMMNAGCHSDSPYGPWSTLKIQVENKICIMFVSALFHQKPTKCHANRSDVNLRIVQTSAKFLTSFVEF